jgi:hypothetical protein
LLRRADVAEFSSVHQCLLEHRSLVRRNRRDLARADVRREEVRAFPRHLDADDGAPRPPEQNDALGAEVRAQELRDRDAVVGDARNREIGGQRIAVVTIRFAGAGLIPLHDRVPLFERRELDEQRTVAAARAAVHHEDDGIASIAAADGKPLLPVARRNVEFFVDDIGPVERERGFPARLRDRAVDESSAYQHDDQERDREQPALQPLEDSCRGADGAGVHGCVRYLAPASSARSAESMPRKLMLPSWHAYS